MGFRSWLKNLRHKPYDIGTVLLKMGVVEAHDLLRAVRTQQAAGGKKLGEVMLALGMIRMEHLDKALELQARLRNGGRIEAMAEITQHNLNSALRRLTPPPKVTLT